jgi:hypothetical protein
MTKTQESMRIVARFLRLQSLGYVTTPEESKLMSDLLWLTLPMKYRMNREELMGMEAQVVIQKQEAKERWPAK